MAPHLPVLPGPAIEALAIDPAGTYVDATFGAGGHSRLILARLGPAGRAIAFDADPGARVYVPDDPRFTLIHADFRRLEPELAERSIAAIDGVLYDLGVSSMQLDEPARGFSFRTDAPLGLRMDTSRGRTAAEFLADCDEVELADV